MEKTFKFKQTDIASSVPIASSQQVSQVLAKGRVTNVYFSLL
jgi:hypothetical protein